MIKYKFDEDEVLLFRGKAYAESSNDCLLRVLTTNKYLVFMPYYNEENVDEESIIKIEVGLIKIYENQPQIKKYENNIEIYLTNDVLTLTFPDKKEEREFVSALNKLLTGKTTAERNMETIGKKINFFDKTFGTNTVETVKNAITTGLSGALGAIKFKNKGAKITQSVIQKSLASISKTHTMPPSQQALLESKANDIDNTYDQLIKLKNLLDQGIITQEEFDIKKSNLLKNN